MSIFTIITAVRLLVRVLVRVFSGQGAHDEGDHVGRHSRRLCDARVL